MSHNLPWTDYGTFPNNEFDLVVVIGRFQPFHVGHKYLLEKAEQLSRNRLLLIGSAFIARDIDNPFTFKERSEMVNSVVGDRNWRILPIQDDLYSLQVWVGFVQTQVNMILEELGINPKNARVAIAGHNKDSSSYYLQLFPSYKFVEVGSFGHLDATTIRQKMFDEQIVVTDVIPEAVRAYILDWTYKNTETYQVLVDEYVFIKNYKKQYEEYPYSPVFVTVDAVVLCHGHVLLVKRRCLPGKGLWALPGGFLEPNEFVIDGIIRELFEETRVKVDPIFLRASMKGFPRVFDHPNRSKRGRTITHAGLFVLDTLELPKIRGQESEVEKVRWVPLAEFYDGMSSLMFEDHYSIINYMVNRAS
jgi:bifunctional NMN adenylyltransferase/nudix hydrolase